MDLFRSRSKATLGRGPFDFWFSGSPGSPGSLSTPFEVKGGGLVCYPNKVGNQTKEKPKKYSFRKLLSSSISLTAV